MTIRGLLTPLLAFFCLLAPWKLPAQVTPVAGPFEVSPRVYSPDEPGTYQTQPPSLAALSDGSFVVAWEEDLAVDVDGGTLTFYDLYARQVRAGGRPGRLVRVDRGSEELDRFPGSPELAGDGQGGFTLAWDRSRSDGADVLVQHAGPGRFVRPGAGNLIRPAQEGEGALFPAVGANAVGDWVIAWEEWLDSGGARRHVSLRAFDASGVPSSPEIRIVPANPDVSLSNPRVAVLEDRFVVVWGASGGPRPTVLQGRLFALDGTPLSPIFQVGRLQGTIWDVLTDEEGGFWVAWQSRSPDTPSIRITHYSLDGLRLGAGTLGASSGNWGVHMNRRGEIAFVWTAPDGRVLLQVLDRLLVPQGARQVVTRTGGALWFGDVAIGDTGELLVVWISSQEVTTPGGATHHPLVGKLWQVEE